MRSRTNGRARLLGPVIKEDTPFTFVMAQALEDDFFKEVTSHDRLAACYGNTP